MAEGNVAVLDASSEGRMLTTLTQEGVEVFGLAIYQCLQRWTALQLAVQNEWGGRSSASKFQQFHTNILNFFTASKEQRYFDEVETLLDEYMLDNFSTEVDDGSVFEVTEQLMTVHEQCMLGNFENVRKMITPADGNAQSVINSKQLATSEDHGDTDGSNQMESGHQAVDRMESEYPVQAPNSATLSTTAVAMASQPPLLTEEETSEGWQAAPTRKSRRGKLQ